MKKRVIFFHVLLILAIICCSLLSWTYSSRENREFYQLTVYHFTSQSQEIVLDSYLKNALLPALHRIGVKNIGVMKAHANDTTPDKTLYVLVPVQSLNMLIEIPEKLRTDNAYQSAGSEYINAPYTAPPYSRMENLVLRAFPLAPQMKLPELNGLRRDRVYELRSYESATEKNFKNKVQMFNDGDEIGLFKRLNFNAIFYGEVIAGSKMPNLMYVTCHENKMKRDANWKAFVDDPYWKKLSSMSEYQHNVSHIDINFLYPTDYSDF